LVGRTELDVAHEVHQRLVDEGHHSAEFAIVGSGPNSASPHHEASARVIGAGEPIVLDIGGRLGGYHSDVTRTLWVTGEADVLRDEGEAYAAKLLEAGVPTTAVRFAAIIHDFVMLDALRDTYAANAAIELAISTLRKALN